MVCIFCGNKTEVTNSRKTGKGIKVWRRRACLTCKSEWTTIESAELSSGYRVERREGVLEPFNQTKLLISVYESCKHRGTATEDAEALTDTVLSLLQATRLAIWPTSLITRLTSQTLRQFDTTAASLYAALHK